jgi:hypothetical protein
MLKMHPSEFHYHPLEEFGEGGLRFREANDVIGNMLRSSKIKDGGLSHTQVKEFVLHNWQTLTKPGESIPAYIQLDHVYGFSG